MTLEQRTKLLRSDPARIRIEREYMVGNVSEVYTGRLISNFFDEAKKLHNIKKPFFATNIDKIVRVNDDFKAIFEIKYSPNNYDVMIKYNQWRTLWLMAKKLKCPAYIIVENGKYWYALNIEEITFTTNVKRVPLNDMEIFDDISLIDFLAELIR